MAFGLPGCGDSDSPGGGHAAVGGAGAGGAGPDGGGGRGGQGGAICGTSHAELPTGLETLSWDNGVKETNVREQSFAITVDGKTFALNDEPLYEAVRFDLERPATIYGFSIHWGAIGEAPLEAELSAGLYADFGHNGFDFWAPDPLWTGSKCVGDADADGWTTYALDQPYPLVHPGLVYVAHRAEPGAPVFDFDADFAGDGTCALFADCHSALNLPEALKASYFNGVSFPLQYDYLVRLHVAYTEEPPAQTLFQLKQAVGSAHASFGDYDGDGDDDLVTDGPRLHANQGDGTFVDVTDATGIGVLGIFASGAVFGDYDNDGCMDLFAFAESYSAPDTLLHNGCDGTFSDATSAAGIVDTQSYETCNDPANTRSPTAGASWVDLDGDGFLDLYLANFICWDKGTFYSDTVLHNRGDGTFEDWSTGHGFSTQRRAGRGANAIDYDADGDMDVFVNNYRLQANFLFVGDGSGDVSDKAKLFGAAGSSTNGVYYGHTIGSAFGDLDGDGDFDLVSANLAHPRFYDFSNKTEILLQEPNHHFVDAQGDWLLPSGATGLRYQETHSVPALADFDGDGDLDLIVTAIYDGRPTDFYWGNGDASFVLDSFHSGLTTKNGWGVALADVDLDGDVDAFATDLFENRVPAQGHWLEVRPVGNVSSNRAAVGATVRVTAGGTSQLRYVQGGTGQGGQDSMALHFGLAGETSVEEIVVRYPGGGEVVYSGPFDADQRVWVYEDGAVLPGFSNPP